MVVTVLYQVGVYWRGCTAQPHVGEVITPRRSGGPEARRPGILHVWTVDPTQSTVVDSTTL